MASFESEDNPTDILVTGVAHYFVAKENFYSPLSLICSHILLQCQEKGYTLRKELDLLGILVGEIRKEGKTSRHMTSLLLLLCFL